MNEKTGELKKYKVFCCPKCKNEVTDWMLAHAELNYCSRCGNRNYKPDLLLVKTCWYEAVVGAKLSKAYCRRYHPMGCDDCWYFLPDPPEPEDKDAQDDMPSVR